MSGAVSGDRWKARPPAAQVSAADLQNAKLSEQAALATAYFDLRAAESSKRCLIGPPSPTRRR